MSASAARGGHKT